MCCTDSIVLLMFLCSPCFLMIRVSGLARLSVLRCRHTSWRRHVSRTKQPVKPTIMYFTRLDMQVCACMCTHVCVCACVRACVRVRGMCSCTGALHTSFGTALDQISTGTAKFTSYNHHYGLYLPLFYSDVKHSVSLFRDVFLSGCLGSL